MLRWRKGQKTSWDFTQGVCGSQVTKGLQHVMPSSDLLGDSGMEGGYGLYTEGMNPENRADLDAQFQ